jgi:hypothetical protein
MAKEYVNNQKFLEALVEYKKQVKLAESNNELKPKIPEYIGECILAITENIAKRPNFSGYTFIADMKGDAIENCLTYLHNFNEEASKNAFSYFSTIIWYAFLRRIDRESSETYVKFKPLEGSSLYTDHVHDRNKFVSLKSSILNQNTIHIIEKYEEKMKKKKKIRVEELTKLEEFMD